MLLATVLALSGCGVAPDGGSAPGDEAPGILRADATPGPDAVTRPQWRIGDKFTFRRGASTISTEVVSAGPEGYRLRDLAAGVELLYDVDLAELGQDTPKEPRYRLAMAPGDPREHWPLWTGKRWEAEVALRVPGLAPRLLRLSYECDAKETLRVPAGEFECYRIWRRSRSARGDRDDETVSVHWYAPKIGHFVKRLENGVLLELESWKRGPQAADSPDPKRR